MFQVEQLLNNLTGYLEARFALAKLDLQSAIQVMITHLLWGVALLLLASGAIVMASVALALALGNWLESNSLGFFIVSLLYTFSAVFVLRKKSRDYILSRLEKVIAEQVKSTEKLQ